MPPLPPGSPPPPPPNPPPLPNSHAEWDPPLAPAVSAPQAHAGLLPMLSAFLGKRFSLLR